MSPVVSGITIEFRVSPLGEKSLCAVRERNSGSCCVPLGGRPAKTNRIRSAIAASVFAVLFAAAIQSAPRDIVGNVSQSSCRGYLENNLCANNGNGRGPTGEQHDLAMASSRDAFIALGLDTTCPEVTYGGVNTCIALNSFGAGELSGLTLQNGRAAGAMPVRAAGKAEMGSDLERVVVRLQDNGRGGLFGAADEHG